MLIIINDNNKLIKNKFENYYKYKGIVIDVDKDKISLQDNYSFCDFKKEAKLQFCYFEIKDNKSFNLIKLYLYKIDEGIFDYVLYENRDFILSNNINSSIVTNDKYFNNKYLVFRNGFIDTNIEEVYLNGFIYKGENLKDGDLVETISFSFYYFDDYLYINSFLIENRLNKIKLIESAKRFEIIKPKINNFFEDNKYELVIDKLELFNAPHKGNSKKLILQMGPTLTMSLAMILVSGINIYNSYLNNGTTLSMVALIVMPFTMLVSGVMWPIITSSYEKREYKKEFKINSNNYLKYLKDYETELIVRINKYRNSYNYFYFDETTIKNKLFYISNKSSEFLKISIGHFTNTYINDFKYTKYKDIDESISRIKYRLENIEDFPLFIDLKENKRITVLSNSIDKKYLLNRIFLELISKYSYQDVAIAIFSKDKSILKDIYSIPHLFNYNRRLTFINERELQDLNTSKIDKPVVLLMNDYSKTIFNENISVIYFSDNNESILKDCDAIVEYGNEGILNLNGRIKFKYEFDNIDFNYFYEYISNTKVFRIENKINTFKDIFGKFNIYEKYSNKPNGLIASFAYSLNEVVDFDLHESKDGPHGLIGGSTGSGKSELIISLLLSLALRYSPTYLNIILIDYKGAGIKESLSYNQKTIPHIIAAINNLEEDTFERLMVAISRECKRRQRLFKELSDAASQSIMNIDDYLSLNESYSFEKIAHLLIVVDEFAELKKENPLLIKELISLSRIGRSLGLHLILATQKPSGVIDDEIWSNSHFKIALKVLSEKDSIDIIKNKDASYLQSAGEFYLSVDDSCIKAKAVYSKMDVNGNDQYEVSLLDNTLDVINRVVRKNANPFKEANYLTRQILKAQDALNITVPSFEFEKPVSYSVEALKNKYSINNLIVMGEVDDYLNARRYELVFNINENLLIYSNRNNEINNILNQLNTNKIRSITIAKEKYIGSYIADSLTYEQEEDIEYAFKKLLNNKDEEIHLVIEDLNTLLSYNDDYLTSLYELQRRSLVCKVTTIVLSKSSTINFKLLNCFKNKVAIDIYDNQDLINLFSSRSEYKGKSYFFDETPITFIPCLIENYNFLYPVVNEFVDKIPMLINYEYQNNNLLIGYDLKTREKIYVDDNRQVLVTSFDINVLNKLKAIFINNSNIVIAEYSNKLLHINFMDIIWLKDGVDRQKLFYADSYRELDTNEAYYYTNNRIRYIRMVNYE